jgi:hypothetical protein
MSNQTEAQVGAEASSFDNQQVNIHFNVRLNDAAIERITKGFARIWVPRNPIQYERELMLVRIGRDPDNKEQGRLSFSYNGSAIYVVFSVPIEIDQLDQLDEDVEFAVNATVFMKLLNGLLHDAAKKDGIIYDKLYFTGEGSTVTLGCDQNRSYTLRILPASIIPQFEMRQEKVAYWVHAGALTDAIELVRDALCVGTARYYGNYDVSSIYIQVEKNRIIAFATDMSRIHYAEIIGVADEIADFSEAPGNDSFRFILPIELIDGWLHAIDYAQCEQEEGDRKHVVIAFDVGPISDDADPAVADLESDGPMAGASTISFRAGSTYSGEVYARVKCCGWPAVITSIPEREHAVVWGDINTHDFSQAVKSAAVLAEDRYSAIKIHLEKSIFQQVVFSYEDARVVGKSRATCVARFVDIKDGIEPDDMLNLCNRYLRDIAAALPGIKGLNSVDFVITGDGKRSDIVFIKGVTEEQEGAQYRVDKIVYAISPMVVPDSVEVG